MTENRSWSWRHAILKSDLPATTRHVLLTVSCFMNDVGGGCYPTQEQIAEASGLTDRSVRQHIEVAIEAGWLKRKEHGFRGQKWRNYEYEASWPSQDVEAPAQHIEEGAERLSGAFGERAEPHAEGAEADGGKVRNDVPTILPEQHSNQRSVDARVVEDFEQNVFEVFPQNPSADRPTALRRYLELTPAERIACKRGALRVALRFDEAETDEPLDQRLKYHPHLPKWIASRGWELELVS